MSGRKWKPGDVAMVTWRHRRRIQPFTEHIAVMTVDGEWAFEDGRLDGDSEARPLVVIDPEDREQVERLAGLIARNGKVGEPFTGAWSDKVQGALRCLVAKPPEPTGLGAVVEDVEGRLWVRLNHDPPTDDPWKPYDSRESRCHYAPSPPSASSPRA